MLQEVFRETSPAFLVEKKNLEDIRGGAVFTIWLPSPSGIAHDG